MPLGWMALLKSGQLCDDSPFCIHYSGFLFYVLELGVGGDSKMSGSSFLANGDDCSSGFLRLGFLWQFIAGIVQAGLHGAYT